MKLLFDENLSRHLAQLLADIFPDSVDVRSAGFGGATDQAVWEFAKGHGFVLVTKDEDFQRLSVLRGPPPKGPRRAWSREAIFRRSAAAAAPHDPRSDWRGCAPVDLRSCIVSRVASGNSPRKSGRSVGAKARGDCFRCEPRRRRMGAKRAALANAGSRALFVESFAAELRRCTATSMAIDPQSARRCLRAVLKWNMQRPATSRCAEPGHQVTTRSTLHP